MMNFASRQALPIHLAAITLAFVICTDVSKAQVQLNLLPGLQLSWPENTSDTYHLQWSSNPVTTWTDLMAAAGNGLTNTYFDPFPIGKRTYQLLDIVPGIPASSALPSNGGFESGTGSGATGWTVDTAAGGPVYGIRTNDQPHNGSFNFQVYLASTGAGPVVQFNQSGIPVTGGTTNPFTFYANALSGSGGYSAQWRILWNTGGDTGYQTYTPGNSAYASISNSVTAPAGATSATIFFHFAGAASPGVTSTIDLDDVVLGSGVSNPGTPAVTNILPVAMLPVAQISWSSISGVEYQPELTTNLGAGLWNTNFPAIAGDGGTKSFLIPMTNSATFLRLLIPPVVVLPPSNLQSVPSGTTNAIGLTWNASTSPGVTGYEVLYVDTNSMMTNSINLGLVTSTVISGLTSGQTYFVSIITLSSNGPSNPSATIPAQAVSNQGGVVWSTDFSSGVINPGTWTYDVGGTGWGNGQLEYDTAQHGNTYITNGNLVLEADRTNYWGNSFTSARMLTQGRFAFKYGNLEARIKVPNTANGLWPAFWMMGNNAGAITWPNCGELDIMELGAAAGIASNIQDELIDSAIHYADTNNNAVNAAAWLTAPEDLTQDYHLYQMSWTPTNLTFSLDNVPFGSWNIANIPMFQQPMFLILNIAIGGYDPSYTGVYSPGAVTAAFPAKMDVDYIRITDNGFTQLYFGDNSAENGNFGVFAGTTPVNDSLTYGTGLEPNFAYGTNAALYTWNNMTPSANPPAPSEGTSCWSFDIAGGNWFGMGVFLPNFRNMKNYSDGYLHFDIRTTAGDATPMQVGIQSCVNGQLAGDAANFWLPLGIDQTSEFWFPHDGQWHSLKIPLNRFANVDFRTVNQLFQISSVVNPTSALNLSIDNVWWEPSATRVTPQNGNFGVFSETPSHQNAGAFALGVQGNFFVWANTMVPAAQHPYEGTNDISLAAAPGMTWSGMAFTPNNKYNLTAYQYANCNLEFTMKTTSTTSFMIGMKSGNLDGVGQKWINFGGPGSDPYGFVRDGAWHVVDIPMSDFGPEVDLSAVSQFFEILSQSAPISNIELDDIHFTNGGVASPPDQ
jgi:beta-glucanase (GH16 family)